MNKERHFPSIPKEKSIRVKCKVQGCPFLANYSGYCQKHFKERKLIKEVKK